MLGLFISSLLRSSAASLVILLLAWAVIVVIIPDIGGTIATNLRELPSSEIVRRNARAARDKERQEYNARHPNAGRWESGNWSPRENLGRAMAVDDAGMDVYSDYLDTMLSQVRFGYNVTRISPTVIYRRAVETVAASGIDHIESFMKQARRYRSVLRDFLLDHYPLNIHRQHDDQRKFTEALSTRTFAAADVPKFHDAPIPMEDSMKNSMWDIAILFIFNIALLMAAYISFLYRDVR
jgi:ABC-type transport system involved in multi-copper enzyme maturation permease subunit